MSGGAGYILGRESIRRFVEEALPDPMKCKNSSGGYEDAQLGVCLYNVGVTPVDTRDHNGRHRILPFSPGVHLQSNSNKSLPIEFSNYIYYPYKHGGPDCCSEYMISFHYVDEPTMFVMENLLYHIRPVGFLDEFLKSQLQNSKEMSIAESLKEFALKISQPINKSENKDEV